MLTSSRESLKVVVIKVENLAFMNKKTPGIDLVVSKT